MAKSFVNISPYRFHWAMCTHMPSLKGNVRSPLGTEAVSWIAKNAECSQEDAVKIFDSAYKAGAIISAAGKFRGDWKELLDRNISKWAKKIKAAEVKPRPGKIPDGEHDFMVSEAEEDNGNLELTLAIAGYSEPLSVVLRSEEEFAVKQFLSSTGHDLTKDILLTAESVMGWSGRVWLEAQSLVFVTSNTGDVEGVQPSPV